ncbi:hypothetical protein O6H91_04G016400 [Diphasiastrum complanatum]|uniref:Uncharacterized protein n=1 Tax=Diphasiastrum complanatum TaxID=34168 RepID=A0ACC2DUS8_DIPCM|nr:hypothetical protein O6H91_04G016400 [Diphasiastrum complanatum]
MADHVVLDIVFPAPDSLSVPPSLPPAVGDPDQVKEHVVRHPCNDEGEGEADRLLSGSCMSPGDGTVGDGAMDSTKGVAPVLVDCRICQEEEESGNLEIPCACSGSLKYAHRKCVQRWCNEKGDTTCEICHQPYKNGYEAPAQPGISNDGSVERQYASSNVNWGVDAQHLEVHDPTVLAIWEADYDEYTIENGRVAACCRSAALILMSLLLLRHVLGIAASGSEEDTSAFFALFLVKAAGFLLPCYVIARAVSILQHRRQPQVAEVAEPETASLVQAEEAGGMQLPSSASYSS